MERYEVAATRHLTAGEILVERGLVDDAGYHFGVSGENSIKYALRAGGVEAAWNAAGLKRRQTAMGKHLPHLRDFLTSVQTDVALYAQGRLAGPLVAEMLDSTFPTRFDGWSIDIRYADDACTPVLPANCDAWAADAQRLIINLVLA